MNHKNLVQDGTYNKRTSLPGINFVSKLCENLVRWNYWYVKKMLLLEGEIYNENSGFSLFFSLTQTIQKL